MPGARTSWNAFCAGDYELFWSSWVFLSWCSVFEGRPRKSVVEAFIGKSDSSATVLKSENEVAWTFGEKMTPKCPLLGGWWNVSNGTQVPVVCPKTNPFVPWKTPWSCTDSGVSFHADQSADLCELLRTNIDHRNWGLYSGFWSLGET